MKEKVFNSGILIKLQRITWYLVLAYFGAVSAMFWLDMDRASFFAPYGVILVLVATGIKLIVMAEQYRLAGLRRFWGLSYLLVMIMIAIVVVRYWL